MPSAARGYSVHGLALVVVAPTPIRSSVELKDTSLSAPTRIIQASEKTRLATSSGCAKTKKHHTQNLKRKNLGTANLSNFDEQGKKRITEQVLVSMTTSRTVGKNSSIASSVSTPRSPSNHDRSYGRGGGGGVVLVADIVVLAAGSTLKRAMPISIQSNLPHISLQFGADLDCPNCPSIRCAVDLCAALTTGNFHFFASVAKRFPHCVAKMYTADDYAPIVLSGVVQSNQESVTTKLEVGFLFHLLYRTRVGDTSSLMVAPGPNVSVNTILGLPFMKATGMVLDLVDEFADCRYLECPPFPVDFAGQLTTYLSWTTRVCRGTITHHHTFRSSKKLRTSSGTLTPRYWLPA
jgi:hypothetical protein